MREAKFCQLKVFSSLLFSTQNIWVSKINFLFKSLGFVCVLYRLYNKLCKFIKVIFQMWLFFCCSYCYFSTHSLLTQHFVVKKMRQIRWTSKWMSKLLDAKQDFVSSNLVNVICYSRHWFVKNSISSCFKSQSDQHQMDMNIRLCCSDISYCFANSNWATALKIIFYFPE